MILKIHDTPGTDTPITDAWEHPEVPLHLRPVTLCRQLERAAAAADVARFEALIEVAELKRKNRDLSRGICLDQTPRVKSIEEFFTLFAS
jgi:hypothetical protein